MAAISSGVHQELIARAEGRCEYCGLSQESQEAVFHIDHVVPRVSGGQTSPENLALACVSCSLRKGAREVAVDPETKELHSLFNPRREQWGDHFRWVGLQVLGLSGTGRATVEALKMNRLLILAIRREEAIRGRHPFRPQKH